jgi:4-hydroxy-3-polyprenylbenzoate decarboxylase
MTFYTRPKSVDEMVTQSVNRMLDLLNLEIQEHDDCEGRWDGFDWKKKREKNASNEL